ncbi:MAG: hypothetical protein KJN64_03245 [Ignavibacteria bacterium]|nr:hypothetical protein [Ignavibacteria bacterium]MBT8381374.1 hypothetical protein [Ignavibacteria bacterium]MBT8390978.1 hypothetical protein [Ignavibacteria bacterium]NNJ54386.1 hypothetical protein [Ignavibacteriaceae bacterium]NNL21698.1 hypothetical protein [Ignavibacteriaceae bacterium]
MRTVLSLAFLLILNSITIAQTTVNPDISAVGEFNMFTSFAEGSPEYGKLNFDIPNAEIYVEGYLNPYARATFNIAFHEGEFHGEEIFAEIVRGLPLDIQIKAGKYLLGFGKINTIHPHAWAFVYRPLFQQIYFGDEGFNDIGFDLSFILPTGDIYTTLDLGIFKGDALTMSHKHEHSEEHMDDEENHYEVNRGNSPIFIGRLSSFFSLGDFSNLEVGLSSSYGIYNKLDFYSSTDSIAVPDNKALNYFYGGIDFKFKYRPDSYTAFVLQTEALWNRRNVLRKNELDLDFEKNINTFGAFVYFDYRFNRIFSIGAKYDFTYGIIEDEPKFNTLSNDDQNKTSGIEGWFGYYPIEETLAFRLGVQHLMFSYADATERDDETKINLQLIFSLGPHKAHPF